MKNWLSIFLSILFLFFSSCVRDSLENCAGKVRFFFVYGTEPEERQSFFEQVESDLDMHLFIDSAKYREEPVIRAAIGPSQPFEIEKWPVSGKIDVITWSRDSALVYTHPMGMHPAEGSVVLKETEAGNGICKPVKDLFYGSASFISDRLKESLVIVPTERAVCRVHITLIPATVQDYIDVFDTRAALPPLKEYTFRLHGTVNTLDYANRPKGDEITLEPDVYYNETTRNLETQWFGAFPSIEGKYLSVDVFLRGIQVAAFDCAPLELTSEAGKFIDLVIDGRYVRPELAIHVNGWKVAVVTSDM